VKTKTIVITAILFLIVAVLPFNVSYAGTTWTIETVDATGSSGALYTSLALDSNDNPHISYQDWINYDLKYAKKQDSTWATEIAYTYPLDPFTLHTTSLALDSNDNPHIVHGFMDGDLVESFLIYTWWEGSTMTSAPLGLGDHCSLALDSNDNPHISYANEDDNLLMYTWYTGSAWLTLPVCEVFEGGLPSLALDSNVYPHIAYSDNVGGLRYVRWTGSDWSSSEIVDVIGVKDTTHIHCSLALDSNDQPCISYYNIMDNLLKFARRIGSTWYTFNVDVVVSDWQMHCSLALDSESNPCISYRDFNSGDLRYAKWTEPGSLWNIQTVDSTGDVGFFCSLALDSNDNAHISYWDHSHSALKYAYSQAVVPTGSITINDGDEYTSSPEVTLDLTYSAQGATVHDIRLSNDGVWDTETWDIVIPSKQWTLASGDGAKTVWYQIRDWPDGMISSTYSDSITVDTTPPTGSITINGGDASTDSAEVTLSLTYGDATSGVDKVRYTNNAVWGSEPWQDPAPTKQWTLKTGEGTRTVRYQVRDSVGHKSVTYEDDIVVEINDPPTVGLISGPTYGTIDVVYSWTVTGSDPDGDDLTYEWQLDGQTQGATGSSLTHTFGDSDYLGNHKIRVRAVDEEGETSGWTEIIFTLGVEKNDPPMISEISGPDSAFVGDSCTWTASATDPEGSDVTIYWFINGAAQGSGDSFTYSFETEPAGKYTIQARAKDVGGASSGYVVLAFVLMEESGFETCFFDVSFKEEVYVVKTCSNSSVLDLAFNQTLKRIRLSLVGVDGTAGFCNVTFPAELLSGDFTVFLDAVELVEGVNYSESFNGTHHTLSVNYEHSSHKIDVVGTNMIPDFAASLFLPLVMIGTLLALTLRKKLKKLM